MLVGVPVLAAALVVAPNVTYWTPELLPETQNCWPSSVVALRTVPAENELVICVVVSTVPARSMRATTRETVALAVPDGVAVPGTRL